MRLVRRVYQDQSGITGLETAIILIAFVMVASVFAYVVLSAGLFSSQKAKEAVYAGLEETRSTLELKGGVILKMESDNVTEIYFTIGSVRGGAPVDLTDTNGKNVVIISYTDTYRYLPSLPWTLTRLNSSNSDNLTDPNELFMITVDMRPVSDNVTPEKRLGANKTFMLEIKPPTGAVLPIERTVPARVNQLINLY